MKNGRMILRWLRGWLESEVMKVTLARNAANSRWCVEEPA